MTAVTTGTADGLPSQLPDVDSTETGEWVDSFRALVDVQGQYRARYVLLRLSMGLGPINAVYQARFNRNLHARALGHVKPEVVVDAVRRYRLDEPDFYPTGVSAGGDA